MSDTTFSTQAEALDADALRARFSDCADFECRAIWPGQRQREGVYACWIDGLVSSKNVSEDVLCPLTDAGRLSGTEDTEECVEALLLGAVWACSVRRREKPDEVANDLLHGCCAVVFDSTQKAVSFEVRSTDSRSISPPAAEKTIKGAKDAFVETLRTNTSLVRRRLRTPTLKLRQTVVGRRSGTDVAVLWLEGVANRDTLEAVLARLDAIDVDGLTAAGNLEQYITDRPGSLFPQLLHTERPDKFAAELLAGRVGILADGLPLGFLLPAPLPVFLHVADDRAQHWAVSSLLLLLRWLSMILSMFLPALFVAAAMYHQEMIPTRMLLSMIEAKQFVPFSAAVEIVAMLLSFELLMEAGTRLPDPVGDTVSTIGGLIVGQSAVEAKVVSPISVIVVAAAAICGFTQPSRDLGAALRVLRLGMVLLAVAFGLFGVMLGAAGLVWYLCTLESFGVPYTAPMAEDSGFEVLRALVRIPLPMDKYRERALRTGDRRSQK